MKTLLKGAVLAGILLVTAACAGPKFAETGTPSSYDGMWTAELPADMATCSSIDSKFEIRYGMLIGTVSEKGRRIADIWGEIDANGKMEGLIGQLGVTGATATVNFQPDTASGTWKSKQCQGTVQAQKVG